MTPDQLHLAIDLALGPDPGDALAAIRHLRADLPAMEARAVLTARQWGWPWSAIGRSLGCSKQAAHQRHTSRHAPAPAAQGPRFDTDEAHRQVLRDAERRGQETTYDTLGWSGPLPELHP